MRQLPPILNGRGIYDYCSIAASAAWRSISRMPSASVSSTRSSTPPMSSSKAFGPAPRAGSACPASSCARETRGSIHCAITGYGQSGPYAERPGHDLNYVSISGMLSADRPTWRSGELPRMFIADVGGGAMTAVIGILAALFGRERHGEGDSHRHLDARRRALLDDAARPRAISSRAASRPTASCRRSASTRATTSTRPATAARSRSARSRRSSGSRSARRSAGPTSSPGTRPGRPTRPRSSRRCGRCSPNALATSGCRC